MKLRRSIVREHFNQRTPLWCFKSNVRDPMVPELLGRRGIECLWLDMEHFPPSIDTMFSLVQACRAADTDALVRVPNQEFALAAKMFDLGADALLYPRCRSAAEIADLIKWVRFPPLGQRGIDTGVYRAAYGDLDIPGLIDEARHRDVVIVQIENRQALAEVDAIAATPGVDALFVGPGDMSVDMGVPCDPHDPQLAKAIARVAECAAAHDLPWGMPAFGLDHFAELLDMGALFITHASDTTLLGNMIKELQPQIAQLIRSQTDT